MTPTQRRLRTRWLLAAFVLSLVVVFNDFLEANAGWLRWVAFLGMFVAALGEGRSRSEMRAEASANLADLAEAAPWLKAWFAFWAASFFIGAIYVTRNSIDVFDLFGLRFLVLSFAVLIGPIVILSERHHFQELGEGDDAI
jgi:hypothetical protein